MRAEDVYLSAAAALLLLATSANAQVTPAAGYVPPDDTPSIRIGATIFADYTVQTEPKGTDVDGNAFTPNAFQVGRAYLNVTGQINHMIQFRITPDIVRETGSGSSLTGSYTYRLKYAYAQFNMDDWMTRGSYARFGMQQTPWVDFMETVYRYRFQGTIFEDREGYLSSSDVGATFRYNFGQNYGEVLGGFYNGENYNRAETNDQKAFMVRGTVRPLPMGSPAIRGLRVTGFWDHDAYVKNAERLRHVFAVTYQHPYVNGAFDYLWAEDQPRATSPTLDSNGYSVWVTPRTTKGWEGLLRFDHLDREQATTMVKGVTAPSPACGPGSPQGNVSTVLLFDYEQVDYKDFATIRSDEKRWAVHVLVNFCAGEEDPWRLTHDRHGGGAGDRRRRRRPPWPRRRSRINGAGATFPYPIYSKWFAEYNKLKPQVEINYQSMGSGGGIRQLQQRTVFFGATDGPMTTNSCRRRPARSCIFRPFLARTFPSTTSPA